MAEINQSQVLNALRTVMDPDLHGDIVSLNMVRDVLIGSSGVVSFRVVLTTPACPMKAKIENDCREAMKSIPGITQVNIKMDAEVRGKSGPSASHAIENVTHIIAVSSGKGGVGKSTVAANLAMALKQEGARVGLMDADVYGPNIPTMMGVTDNPKIVDDPKKGEMFLPPISHGIKVMSMGFLVKQDQPVIWRGPMLHSVVQQFCHKVEWGNLDYLVVDMPPGTGDVQLSLAQLVPVTGAILVTTPQEVSTQDVRKAYAMFEQVRIPVMGIVENMSYFVCDNCDKKHEIFGTDGGRYLAGKFGTELLGQLPLVQKVREAGDQGTPIVMKDKAAPVAQAFTELARKVAQQVSIISHRKVDPSQIIQIGRFN
jgi:ATP-binding protein involved in chromosome partitioning